MEKPQKSINEVMPIILANLELQLKNVEVAIPYLVGMPGIGKTAIINHYAKELGYNIISFHLALTPIEEVGGLPRFKEIKFGDKTITGTEWSLPNIMSEIYDIASKSEKVIIFLDDYHISSPSHLALGFEMFTNRTLRGYRFPENSCFILAGNDSVKAGAKQMFSAVVNRVAFFNCYPNYNFWKLNYALKNNFNTKILSFLDNGINRERFFLEEEDVNGPWASPRSWSRLSNLLNELEQQPNFKLDDNIFYITYSHVGPKAASEFLTHYEVFSKFDFQKIFNDNNIKVPENNTELFVYALGASNYYCSEIINNPTNKAKLVNKIATIIVEVAKFNIDIAIAMLQNINDHSRALENKNLSIRNILTKLSEISDETEKRISKSITDIVRIKSSRI